MIYGIDYSITSPAICVFLGGKDDEWNINKCIFMFVSSNKKLEGPWANNIIGRLGLDSKHNNQDRYDVLSNFFIEFIDIYGPGPICVEDYAFAANGRVFHIAENTGLLKWKLWQNSNTFHLEPPTVIKKFATGKGNANKLKMVETFIDETGIDLAKMFGFTHLKEPNGASPVSDIVDAYFMCKYEHSREV